MRIPLAPAIILGIIFLLTDLYIWRTCLKRYGSRTPARLVLWSSVALYVLMAVAVALPRRGGDNATLLTVMWMLWSILTVYASKIVYVAIDLLGRIPGLWHGHRIKAFSRIGAVSAAAVFIAMWWGTFVGRFDIQIKEIDIPVSGLPARFDGYRIAQISDLHTGTFGTDTTFVSEVVDRVNSLGADLVVFTGDIVNSRSSEVDPHISPLSRLKARDGVFAVLGNHDYGDYSEWPSCQAKAENLKHLRDAIRSMGWTLLDNTTEIIRHGADSIALIGVENIGDPPFHTYGSLAGAYSDLSDPTLKILLSHNPAHWTDSIRNDKSKNIALTLAGHTHAMQMQVGGWSPAAYRYPTWGGLYSSADSARKLYVNIGLGEVGLPSRMGGAKPEITLITLSNKDSHHN